METRSLRVAMLRGGGWAAVDRVGTRLVRFAVVAVLARLLVPEHFGVVAVAAFWVDYFTELASQGLGLALIQRRQIEEGHRNATFLVNAGLSVALCAVILVLAPLLSNLLKAPEATLALQIMSVGMIVDALGRTSAAILNRELKFKELALSNISGALGGGVLGVALALGGVGLWSLVAYYLGSIVITRLLLLKLCGWRPSVQCSWRHVRDLYGFSIVVLMDRQFLFLARRIDEALVGSVLGIKALGFYAVAKRLVSLIQDTMEGPVAQVLIAGLSRLQENRRELVSWAATWLRGFFLVAGPVFVGVCVVAEEILVLLYGEQWRPAAGACRWLAVAGLFASFGLAVYPTLLSIGRPGPILALNVVSAALGWLAVWSVGEWGLDWVAGAQAVKTAVMAMLMAWALRWACHEAPKAHTWLWELRGAALVCLLMAVCGVILKHLLTGMRDWIVLVSVMSLGMIIMAGGLLWYRQQWISAEAGTVAQATREETCA